MTKFNQPLYSLTIGEFLSMQKEVLEGFLGNQNVQENTHEDELLDVNQASEFLKISKATIYTLKSKGVIKAANKTGKLLFWKSALIEYLNREKNQTGR
jgi:predicted DNA-binding transcriptional regulator AlpA